MRARDGTENSRCTRAPSWHGVGEHAALSCRQLLRDDAHKGLVAVDKKVLDGLELLSLFVLEDDLGPAHADLEILAPEHLDQDDELELSPAPHDVIRRRPSPPQPGWKRC